MKKNFEEKCLKFKYNSYLVIFIKILNFEEKFLKFKYDSNFLY